MIDTASCHDAGSAAEAFRTTLDPDATGVDLSASRSRCLLVQATEKSLPLLYGKELEESHH
jgi:hypothetical protein